MDGLPRGWEQKVDMRTGRTFYVDHNTRETTWIRPTVSTHNGLSNDAPVNGNGPPDSESPESLMRGRTPDSSALDENGDFTASQHIENIIRNQSDDIPGSATRSATRPRRDTIPVSSPAVAPTYSTRSSAKAFGHTGEAPSSDTMTANAGAIGLPHFDDRSVSTDDISSAAMQPGSESTGQETLGTALMEANLVNISEIIEREGGVGELAEAVLQAPVLVPVSEELAQDFSRSWSSSTLSTHDTFLAPTVQPRSDSVASAMDEMSVATSATLPTTISGRGATSSRRGSIMTSASLSAVSSSTDIGRSKSKSRTYSVSRSLTQTMPENETMKKSRSLESTSRKLKREIHDVDETTSSHSRQLQEHISVNQASLNIRSTDYYIRCGELQNLAQKIKPLMVDQAAANRLTCFKCDTAFGFSSIVHTKKFHCKSCGELYCKLHVKRIEYPPGTNSGETASVCCNCLAHFSSGDVNCILRYYVILRDAALNNESYKDVLHALYTSIIFEEVRKAEGNQRNHHLYPGLYNFMSALSGKAATSHHGFIAFWKAILRVLETAGSMRACACKIIGEVAKRTEGVEDIIPLFHKQDNSSDTGLQLLINCLDDESTCDDASMALLHIYETYPTELQIRGPFWRSAKLKQICSAGVREESEDLRKNIRNLVNVLLSHDSDGIMISKMLELKILDELVDKMGGSAGEKYVIEMLSEISSSLSHSAHYENTVKQFDSLVIRECSKLLDWSHLLQVTPEPAVLMASTEHSALALLEILSESSVSHGDLLLSPYGESDSACYAVMKIISQLTKFGEADGDQWWSVISCALSFELNLLSSPHFNEHVSFDQCRILILACLDLMKSCENKFILHQCIAVLSHFHYSSQFGDLILRKGESAGLMLVKKICELFKQSCDILLLVPHSGQISDDSPLFVPSDLTAFHLLTSILYFGYTANCLSTENSTFLSPERKAELLHWNFEDLYSIIASCKEVWKLIFYYTRFLSKEADTIKRAVSGSAPPEEHAERSQAVLIFLYTFASLEGPELQVKLFRNRIKEKQVLHDLCALFSTYSSSIAVNSRTHPIETVLLAIGSVIGAKPYFAWEEDLHNESAENFDESTTMHKKALLLLSKQRAYFVPCELIDQTSEALLNCHEESWLNKEIYEQLLKALRVEYGEECCLASLRILQCLLRDSQDAIFSKAKQLLVDSRLVFVRLLSSYALIEPYILDAMDILIKSHTEDSYLDKNLVVTFLSSISMSQSEAFDPFSLAKKLAITMTLARSDIYHESIAREMSGLIIEILSWGSDFRPREFAPVNVLFNYCFRIVQLLSSSASAVYEVQSYIKCIFALIQNSSKIPNEQVIWEVYRAFNSEDLPKRQVLIEALLCLSHSLSLQAHLDFITEYTNGESDTLGILLDVTLDCLSTEDVTALLKRSEAACEPLGHFPDDSLHPFGLRPVFQAVVEVLYVMSGAKVPANHRADIRYLHNFLSRAHPSGDDSRIYVLFRLLVQAWSYGDSGLSTKALSVLTRSIAGGAVPAVSSLQFETIMSRELEMNTRTPLMKQLIKDRQIHFFHDVILRSNYRSSSTESNLTPLSSIDADSLIVAKIVACQAIRELINESDDKLDMRKSLLSLCREKNFISHLEVLLTYSLSAAKLLEDIFSWTEIDTRYLSHAFMPLMYRLLNAYLEVTTEVQTVALGVPRTVLGILVGGLKMPGERAAYIISNLPREGTCNLLKHVIDFHCKTLIEVEEHNNLPERFSHLMQVDSSGNKSELIDAVTLLYALFNVKDKREGEVQPFTATEKMASISLCTGILDMLAKEDRFYRDNNDFSYSVPSPRKKLPRHSQKKTVETVATNLDDSTVSTRDLSHDGVDGDSEEDEAVGFDVHWEEPIDISHTLFRTNTEYQEKLRIDVQPHLHSLWKALVTFTSLDYCADALMNATTLLDTVTSIFNLMVEIGKSDKFNQGRRKSINRGISWDGGIFDEANEDVDDHILLTDYCCNILSNIALHNSNQLVDYMMISDNNGGLFTANLTTYCVYVHENENTLAHWQHHNTNCERIMGILHRISCAHIRYCEKIICSNIDLLNCLQESMCRMCSSLEMELCVVMITGQYRKYKAHGLPATYLSSTAGSTTASRASIEMLETLLALLCNLCQSPRGGVGVLLHTSGVFPHLNIITQSVHYIRRELDHPLEAYTKMVQLLMQLGSLASPIQHRVHSALVNFKKNEVASAPLESGPGGDSARIFDFLSPESLSVQNIVSAVSPSSSPRRPLGKMTELRLSTPSSVKSPGNPFQRSAATPLTPVNGEDRGISMWDKTFLTVAEGKLMIRVAPCIWYSALAVLKAFSGSTEQFSLVENAVAMISSLRAGAISRQEGSLSRYIPVSVERQTLKSLTRAMITLKREIDQNPHIETESLTLLYKVMRTFRDLAMSDEDSFVFTFIAEYRILRVLIVIFCGEPAGVQGGAAGGGREGAVGDSLPRRQDWLPVMLQSADLLQVLILDRPVQVQIRLILRSLFNSDYFVAAPILEDGDGKRRHSAVLENTAEVMNRTLAP